MDEKFGTERVEFCIMIFMKRIGYHGNDLGFYANIIIMKNRIDFFMLVVKNNASSKKQGELEKKTPTKQSPDGLFHLGGSANCQNS